MPMISWTESVTTLDDARKQGWLARWADLTSPWEEDAPEYGAFVDQDNRVVDSPSPSRATLDGEDPKTLAFHPEVETLLAKHPGAHVEFVDWGNQEQGWETLFAWWDEWESDGSLLDCGRVQVGFAVRGLWKAPAFLVFRDAPKHTLTRVVVRESKAPLLGSLLARAQQLRDASAFAAPLPMLPFTLENLDDDRVQPKGTDFLTRAPEKASLT